MSSGKPVLVKPTQSGGPNVIVPAAPPKPEFVPDHPNMIYTPGGGVSTLPGVPAPKSPAPNFVPGVPGYTVSDNGTAAPLPGIPGAGIQIDASQRASALQSYNMAKQLGEVAAQLRQLYLKGPGATKGLEGLKDYFPTPANNNFDVNANKSRGIVGMTLGFTGGQLNTPQEAEKGVGPYIPQSSDFDSTILQKIQSMQDLADNGKAKAIQILGGEPDANGNIHPVTPSNPLPPITPPGSGDQVDFATGKTRDVVDPVLKATGTKVGAMIASGVPDAKIIDFLKKSGVDPANTSINDVLKFRQSPDFKRWQRANPGQIYPIGPQFYTKQVPMTEARQLLNKAAASDVGGTAMAAGAAATNAVTGGYLNDLTNDPEAAQTGMDLLRAKHPYASFGGDLAGQMALEGMAGGVPGLGKVIASPWGRRAADALYGAFSGSGESDGNRGVGAVEGAVSGLGFGMFGRGAQRGLGGAFSGIQNADLGYLNRAGIPLTVGRIARGAGDFNPLNPSTAGDELGKGIAGIEDRLAGFPGLDAVINTARQRGDQAFNQAAFREIAPGVGGTGVGGLTSAKAAESAAYAKLAPVRLSVDQPFSEALDNAVESAGVLNHHAGDVNTVINDIRSQINGEGMTGQGYQTAMQAIRKTRATLNDDVGGKAADVLTGLEQAVMDLGNRQGGQVAQDLAEANAIHARREVIKAALKGSPAQRSGEMFSPTALNQASISNTTRFGGLDRALSPDRPFYDLTSAGMKTMPNLTPDSGTAGRLLLYPLIAGAGGAGIGALTDSDHGEGAGRGSSIGTGLGLLALAAGAGPYSRVGQKAIQKALLGERPDAIKRLGQYLINTTPKYAGMFGSALGRDYFFQPELAQ
jgi:hypothetical protein